MRRSIPCCVRAREVSSRAMIAPTAAGGTPVANTRGGSAAAGGTPVANTRGGAAAAGGTPVANTRGGSRVRPQFTFLALATALVAVETCVLASRAFSQHERLFSLAVAFDLAVVPALLAWVTKAMRPSPEIGLGVALHSSLLHEGALRLLSVPAELYLVWLLARSKGDLQERLRAALGDGLVARAVAL